MSTKTEKPTPGYLKRLRQQGHVPRSTYLPGAVGFLLAVALAPALLLSFLQTTQRELLSVLRTPSTFSLEQLLQLARLELHGALVVLAIGLGVVTTALLLVAVAQTGGLVFSIRYGTAEGRTHRMGRLASEPLPVLLSHLTHLLLPLLFVWAFAGWLVLHHAADSISARSNPFALVALLASQVKRLLLAVAVLLTVLGVVDLLVRWHTFKQQTRLTREARTREDREQQGAPETISARRQRRAEAAQLLPLNLLPYCQLVIDDSSTTALLVACHLDAKRSPRVIAVVHGNERRSVLEEATRTRVPLVVHPWLAERLRHRPTDASPPLEIQLVLADVLAKIVLSSSTPGSAHAPNMRTDV